VTLRLSVGIDFDNTLADYDALFRELAAERSLVTAPATMTKRELRDAVRTLPDGEVEWQKLQALAYGPLIHRARVPDGALGLIEALIAAGAAVAVVSHKTPTAGYGDGRTDLRVAATAFMESHGFFSEVPARLRRSDVYFELTRHAKLKRILSLGCTHFIDDLEETFREPSFPSGTFRVLYAPAGAPESQFYTVARTWPEVGDLIMGSQRGRQARW
jgi:hypothetical protein